MEIKRPETAIELALLCAKEGLDAAVRNEQRVADKLMEVLQKNYAENDYTAMVSYLTLHYDEFVCADEIRRERERAYTIVKAASGNLSAIKEVDECLYNMDIEWIDEEAV